MPWYKNDNTGIAVGGLQNTTCIKYVFCNGLPVEQTKRGLSKYGATRGLTTQ